MTYIDLVWLLRSLSAMTTIATNMSTPSACERKSCLRKAILLATPIYNYDVSAAAKNMVELTGSAWRDKTVGFICAAGGTSSYMSVMGLANSLMLDFRCIILPRFVYATDTSHSPMDACVIRRVEDTHRRTDTDAGESDDRGRDAVGLTRPTQPVRLLENPASTIPRSAPARQYDVVRIGRLGPETAYGRQCSARNPCHRAPRYGNCSD